MKKNHILLIQLPGNWPTTKKCAPYFRGNMEFPIYLNFAALLFIQYSKLFKRNNFWVNVVFVTFWLNFFGKMALKKIQDVVRSQISLQKSIERKFLLQARLRNLKCKNFPILKIHNWSKTQFFQNSLKFWDFFLETYVLRNSYCKLHKKSHKIIGWNWRTYGSESGYGWMFSQIFIRPSSFCSFLSAWLTKIFAIFSLHK
jgi:hypothetical protein